MTGVGKLKLLCEKEGIAYQDKMLDQVRVQTGVAKEALDKVIELTPDDVLVNYLYRRDWFWKSGLTQIKNYRLPGEIHNPYGIEFHDRKLIMFRPSNYPVDAENKGYMTPGILPVYVRPNPLSFVYENVDKIQSLIFNSAAMVSGLYTTIQTDYDNFLIVMKNGLRIKVTNGIPDSLTVCGTYGEQTIDLINSGWGTDKSKESITVDEANLIYDYICHTVGWEQVEDTMFTHKTDFGISFVVTENIISVCNYKGEKRVDIQSLLPPGTSIELLYRIKKLQKNMRSFSE